MVSGWYVWPMYVVAFGINCVKIIKIHVYCQWQKRSPVTAVACDIRFVWLFEEVLRRVGVKQEWDD